MGNDIAAAGPTCISDAEAAHENVQMNLAPLLEEQVRIQAEAISLWKRWMVGLVLAGITIIISAQLFPIVGSANSDVLKIGGTFIGVLAAFPYREIVPRKERLATYKYLLNRFMSFESLNKDEQLALLSLANEALKETLKR